MFTLVDAPNYAIEELCDRLDVLLENNIVDENFKNFLRFCRKVINESKSNINTINYNFIDSGNEKFVKLEWKKIYNLLELNFGEYLTKSPNHFSDFSFSFPYNKDKVNKLLEDWKQDYNLPTYVYLQLNELSTLNYLDGAIVNIYVEGISGLVAKKITEVFEEYKLMKKLDVWEEKELSKINEKDSSIKTINFVYDKSKFDQLFSNIKDHNLNKISTYLNKYKDGEKVLIHFSNMPRKVLDNLTKYLLDFDIQIISSGIVYVQGYDIEFEHGFFPKPNLYEFVSLNKEKNNNNKSFKLRYNKKKLSHFVDFVNKDITESDRSDKFYSGFLSFANLIENNLLIPDKDNIVEIAIHDDECRNNLIKLLQLSGFEIVNDNSSVKLTDEGICISGKNIIVDNTCKTFNEVLDRDMNRIYKDTIESVNDDKQNEHTVKLDDNLIDGYVFSVGGRKLYKKEIPSYLPEDMSDDDFEGLVELIDHENAEKDALEFIEKQTRGSFRGAFKRGDTEFDLKNINQQLRTYDKVQKLLEKKEELHNIGVDLSRDFLKELKNMQKSDQIPGLGKDSKQSLINDVMQQLKKVENNRILVPKGTSAEDLQEIKKQINSAAIDNSLMLNNMTLTDPALNKKANNLNSQVLQQAINISNEIKQEEKDLSMNDMLRKSSIRVASVQSTNLISNLMVSIIDRKFDSDTAKSFGIFLESEAGKSLISIIVGNLLRHVPQLKNHKNSKEFSEEFNVAGIAQLGNYVIDEHILGLLSGLTSVLDSVDKVRVEDVAHQISEEDSLDQEAQELLKTNIK